MIDVKREMTTTYQVQLDAKGMFFVMVYPKSPKPIAQHRQWYRLDLLPQWMQEGIRLMDVAGNNHPVEGVGRKVGAVPPVSYWFEADLDEEKTT